MTPVNPDTLSVKLISAGDVLAAPTSTASRVYDDLRQRIVDMTLPPDTTLARTDLSNEYEVSQTPIREAMQRLELDGLVKIFPQSRTIVTRIDIRQLFEAHFLRIALESELVRRLAIDKNPDLVTRLKTIIQMQEAVVDSPHEVVLFHELDEAFHQTMFNSAGQPGLYNLAKSKGGHLSRVRRLDLPREGKSRAILKGHIAILKAISDGDPEKSQVAIRDHLTGTVARIDLLQKEYPNYFRE
ncbi:MAG: GntR family transcriptional regulator [Hyphomicrobiales bacterium]|nr:MAG: GntR family transcriptional regulator [Hyphomicrobiales bacterium]